MENLREENSSRDFGGQHTGTSENNASQEKQQQVQTVTPEQDNGEAGPGQKGKDLEDSNQQNYISHQETQANIPDDDDADDDDYVTSTEDDDDDELIPIEEDDDLNDDGDLADDDDLADEDDLDPLADRPTTFSAPGDFSNHSHGRTTGTMLDHEPGIPGPAGGRQ